MHIDGPIPSSSAHCERILRTLPGWFGIEESLLEYVRDSERFPTFVAMDSEPVAFLTIREHFLRTWEIHCMAVQDTHRGRGIGRQMHEHVEQWLIERGVRLLQVKTLADTHPSLEYAETRQFYASVGYLPLEVFPTLWGAGLPVLQLVKPLKARKNAA